MWPALVGCECADGHTSRPQQVAPAEGRALANRYSQGGRHPLFSHTQPTHGAWVKRARRHCFALHVCKSDGQCRKHGCWGAAVPSMRAPYVKQKGRFKSLGGLPVCPTGGSVVMTCLGWNSTERAHHLYKYPMPPLAFSSRNVSCPRGFAKLCLRLISSKPPLQLAPMCYPSACTRHCGTSFSS